MFIRSVFAASALSVVLFCSMARADIPPPPMPEPEKQAPKPEVPPAPADGEKVPAPTPQEAAAASLVERDGTIALPGGQASIAIVEGFAYLDEADTRKLLTEIWGNPASTAEGVLGAIVPKGVSVLAPESWAAIITYSNEGHVADDDAASINYDDLLKQMQQETADNSEERVKAGYEAMSLVGWAQKPTYDAAGHKLHWAKHLLFGKEAATLNYSIRALGRTGVLEVNVIADMKALPEINAKVPQMLSMVSFNEGSRYADFKDGDPVAAYGLAALIAGGIAAKAGLFKGLLVMLAAFWKVIAVGVVALGAAIWRMFGGKKSETGT